MNKKKFAMIVGIVLGVYTSASLGAIGSPQPNDNKNLVAALEMRDKG